MGEIIQFPRRNGVTGNSQLPQTQNIQITTTSTLRVFIECQGVIHVFGDVPGHCQCGENYWGDDVLPEPPVIGIHEAKQ